MFIAFHMICLEVRQNSFLKTARTCLGVIDVTLLSISEGWFLGTFPAWVAVSRGGADGEGRTLEIVRIMRPVVEAALLAACVKTLTHCGAGIRDNALRFKPPAGPGPRSARGRVNWQRKEGIGHSNRNLK